MRGGFVVSGAPAAQASPADEPGPRSVSPLITATPEASAVKGSLPVSDDRPLYWTRVEAMAVLHQWDAPFRISAEQRADLVDTFDRAARGMFDISLPAGRGVKRVLVSGFDPYTLDGGVTGSAAGAVGNNIRHGNPSGATALSIDGTKQVGSDGTVVFYEAYTLPVSYPEFERGYLEDTVARSCSQGSAGSTPRSPSARRADRSSTSSSGTVATTG